MNQHRYCVIMAGGAGTRLWPMSRNDKPKQFLNVMDTTKSFIQVTFDRYKKIVPEENIIVITNKKYADLVREHLPNLDEKNLLLEPYSRNTATCITYSTYTLLKRDSKANIVVSPSDHLILDETEFVDTINKAFEAIEENNVLMTLGVIPQRADTNYGYIQATGGKAALLNGVPVPVKTFTEKPNKELAEILISTGEFFWNAGIFVWRGETIKEELEKHHPEVRQLFRGWENALGSPLEQDFILKAYSDASNISIDYAVMEKTDRAWIFPVKFDWADIGSWDSLYESSPDKDSKGNVCFSKKKLLEDTLDSMIVIDDKKKLVAVKGLENYIIIDTEDVLVICPKDEKKFKEFVANIAMPEYEKYR